MSRPFPPVALLPGWSDTARVLHHCRDFLVRAGWSADHVACIEFSDPCGSNVEHAAEAARAIRELRERTGSERVGVVAHSMGGLALRHYLQQGGGDAVHTAIFVATPHRGTWLAHLARGRGGAEMRPGSAFLRHLNARPLPTHVHLVCVRTPIDTRVWPGHSAWLDGADCRTVRMPTHKRMLRHAATLRLIRDLLAGAA